MDMFFLLGAALCIFVVISLILPWVQQGRMNYMKRQLADLTLQLAAMRRLISAPTEQAESTLPKQAVQEPVPRPQPFVSTPKKDAWAEPVAPKNIWDKPTLGESTASRPRPAALAKKPESPKKSLSFERDFGARLPIWIGGVALALAGVFLVQYSIQEGWISPLVRTIMAGMFGCGLIAAGRHLEDKRDTDRVVQALWGAGITVLYATIFAASGLYELIPNWLGFIALGGITVLAVSQAVRLGPPIALLGLLGGMLSPMLVGATHLPPMLLYTYLFALVAGVEWMSRRMGWWWLELTATIFGFLWVLSVFSMPSAGLDGFWASLFLLGIFAMLLAPRAQPAGGDAARNGELWYWVKIVKILGSLSLLMAITLQSQLSMAQWGVMIIASAGGLALAWRQPETYRHIPWLLAGMMITLLTVSSGFGMVWLCYAALVAMLFGALPLWIGRRDERPELALVGAISTIVIFLLAYIRCATHWLDLLHWGESPSNIFTHSQFWGAAAIGLAGVAVELSRRDLPAYNLNRRHLLAIHSGLATGMVAAAAGILLERQTLGVALAGEVLGLAWIAGRLQLPHLRMYILWVAGLFGLVLLPQIALMIQLAVYTTTEIALPLQDALPMLRLPLVQLGIPAACFGAAAWMLMREKDDWLVRAFELVAIILTMLCGYYLLRHALDPEATVIFRKANFITRGVMTNLCFLYGLALIGLGLRYDRGMLRGSGNAFLIIGVARILFFDLIAYNPLWSAVNVGNLPLFNALWLPYGLPILWLAGAMYLQPEISRAGWGKAARVVMFALGWVLLSMEIGHAFHGTTMQGTVTQMEDYAYSSVWLIYGAGLLLIGMQLERKALRVAGLVMLSLTVGKVFLYDASNLTGLWRVFSFLALGLSLLGLGYLYGKLNRRDSGR